MFSPKEGSCSSGFYRNSDQSASSVSYEEDYSYDYNSEAEEDVATSFCQLKETTAQIGEVCLCMYQSGCRFGAAYYDAESGRIFALQDVICASGNYEHIQKLIYQVQPKFVVTCRQSLDGAFLSVVRLYCATGNEKCPLGTAKALVAAAQPIIAPKGRPLLVFLEENKFKYEDAKQRIALMRTAAGYSGSEEDGRILANFTVDSQCSSMIRSIGGLMCFLDTRRAKIDFDPSGRAPVLAIRTFALQQSLIVDHHSLNGLQIFQKEPHPSVFKSGTFKEGLSIYGICERCKSGPGRAELRRWFQRPLANKDEIQRRLDAVEFFMQPWQADLVQIVGKCLRYVKLPVGILKRILTGGESVGDWISIYQSIYNSVTMGDLLRERIQIVPFLAEIVEKLTCDDLLRVCNVLATVVNFDEMKEQNRFVVNLGVDDNLDELKMQYAKLPEILQEVALQQVQELREVYPDGPHSHLKLLSFRYVPNIGYFSAIAKDPSWYSGEESLLLPGMEFVFMSDNVAHFKTRLTADTDKALGDIKYKIVDREIVVKLNAQKLVTEIASQIIDAVMSAAQLDSLISLAQVSKDCGWTRPEFVAENLIEIVEGQHPLLERCIENGSVIPNNTYSESTKDQSKIKIIMAPNASGKSVYLKQIGVIVYLAQVGCFVPAKYCRLGVIDRIYTRIYTTDSVSEGMSTFAVDVAQMSAAVDEATEHSLVIVDEFGKGTRMETGLGLLVATIEWWAQKGTACPHLFFATHYYTIDKLLPNLDIIRYQTMEVLRHEGDLIYLFKLVDGSIQHAYAAPAALKAGLPKPIVDRMTDIFNCLQIGDGYIPPHMTKEQRDNMLAKNFHICEMLEEFDPDQDDVVLFLQEVLAISELMDFKASTDSQCSSSTVGGGGTSPSTSHSTGVRQTEDITDSVNTENDNASSHGTESNSSSGASRFNASHDGTLSQEKAYYTTTSHSQYSSVNLFSEI